MYSDREQDRIIEEVINIIESGMFSNEEMIEWIDTFKNTNDTSDWV